VKSVKSVDDLPPSVTDSVVTASQLTVVRAGLPLPAGFAGELVVSDDEVRRWLRSGQVLARLGRYAVTRLVTERLSTSGRPMLMWALRLMGRRCFIVDCEGRECQVTFGLLARWSWGMARDAASRASLLRRIEREIDGIEALARTRPIPAWDRQASPLYLRTDVSFGVRAGGSVGHIAGVVNELVDAGGPPILLTTAPVPTIRPDVEVHQLTVSERFWNFRELPALVLNGVVVSEARRAIAGRRVSMVYQRYSVHSYAGLALAQHLRVPFVLEYNGSEVWMNRHWGRPLKYEALAERIERVNALAADLVVVVSRPMRDELIARGVPADRILVNPNAVDPERYRPDADGTAVRRRFALNGKLVLGFISTFQAWHGAEVLAAAFAILMRDHSEYRESVRLLMVGTGPRLEPSKQLLGDAGLDEAVTFAGLVPQEEGPQYLAASDVLVSPHVRNPDGTPFFGSPTKLFEYMATGRGIVASNLDQIGEVLHHGETGWLVPPGDPEALAAGLAHLIADRDLRLALGDAARRSALAQHTWRAHVRATLEALESRVGVRVA
jgi:glycosyltransferase involved in cell wall biosynthesis